MGDEEMPMPTRNINLTEHFDGFIARGVASGRYGNASEVVREALRLLEQSEQEGARKLQALRKAGGDGFEAIDKGEGLSLEGDKVLDDFLEKTATRVKRTRKRRLA